MAKAVKSSKHPGFKAVQNKVAIARQQKSEFGAVHDAEVDRPAVSYKAVPQKNPDWATLQGEVSAQFSQTIAYLAK